MHVVLAANGHIGSVVARRLLEHREPVTVLLHSPSHADEWERRGAEVAVADVRDTEALAKVFQRARRIFALNPPAAPSTDTQVEERATARSIVAALEDAKPEKIVAQSTYGAQPGERLGDLSGLYELEQALTARATPTRILRGAYYMTNWDAALEPARNDGVLPTFYPPDCVLPMVAPRDLGEVAARAMLEDTSVDGIGHVEGPTRYSPNDVARVFAEALGRDVRAVEILPEEQRSKLRSMGFSEPAADSFARMIAAGRAAKSPDPGTTIRGTTTLQAYVAALVQGK